MEMYRFSPSVQGIHVPYFVLDTFTDKQFHGSPTGVCLLYDEWLDDYLLQSMAEENALPVTAFLLIKGECFSLRWFAPNTEIDLCGHATVGAASIVFDFLKKQETEIVFDSACGPLFARKFEQFVEVDLPRRVVKENALTRQMIDALGGMIPDESYASRDLVFVFSDEAEVRELTPNYQKMAEIEYGDGVIVTAKGSESDFVVRAFFPKLMTNEDPVCGSAHCNLVPYWSERLGKKELLSYQLSARGGRLLCKDKDDCISVAGQTVLYSISEIVIR